MLLISVAIFSLVCAAVPAALFVRNLRAYRPPGMVTSISSKLPIISVLIPVRDEERSIRLAVQSVLASQGVDVEVFVLDDGSEDETGAIVQSLIAQDSRVHLLHGGQLPPGWCGKQHACWMLARSCRRPILVFLDADVRLQPDCLARLTGYLDASNLDFVSGFPFQETKSLGEKLVIPLIHFLLLGFLPLWRMRQSTHPAYAAGCGQLVMVRRSAYEAIQGHAAIRSSLHDGITLPRAFRQAGFKTDICDLTDVATCRMYRTAGEVWRGFSKNATEGLAAPRMIIPATVLLIAGQILPLALMTIWGASSIWTAFLSGIALFASYLPRLLAVRRFRQSWLGAVLHPLGIFLVLAVQWYAFIRLVTRRPARWKRREYGAQLPEHSIVAPS